MVYIFKTMHAHRTRIEVTGNREVCITLPSDFPPGEAEVIVLGTGSARVSQGRKLTVDELLAARLTPPAGVAPVGLDDMERILSLLAPGNASTERVGAVVAHLEKARSGTAAEARERLGWKPISDEAAARNLDINLDDFING